MPSARDDLMPRTPPLTDQQRAAIQGRDTSIALSAGAGCGKTFVLTERFLSHLEPGPGASELSRLVAITFTERAAREMRGRIRKECRRRLDSCDAGNVDYWLSIVRQLDAARISTIHAFCGSLLRAHAVEAGLDPRFKLLDETTSGSLLRNSVAEGLHGLLAGRVGDSLAVVREFGLERACALLEQFTLERYRIDFETWRTRTPGELAAAWEREWQAVAAPQLLHELVESEASRRVLELLFANVPTHPVMQERRLAVLEDLPALVTSPDPTAALDRLLQNARVQGGGGRGAWPDEEVYAQVQEAFTAFRDLAGKTLEQWSYAAGDLVPAAELSLAMLRVTEEVGRTYDERKRSGAWLDFDDLLLGARNLLRDDEVVRRRVSAGISLLLVDEFQDTDPIQTEIVRRLCGEELLSGKLFFVGDVKQSIYRFRRAEPQVFRDLRGDIPARGRLPLSMNFRSQPAILDFVNALFDGALGPEYEGLVPGCKQLSEQPCIEFMFSSAETDEEQAPGANDQSAAARRRREAEWIARRLKQLLGDGRPRVRVRDAATGRDSLRPLAQKDIALLFRAMTDVEHYESALRESGLDYYVVGGHAFFAQQEVFDLVNLCRALDDPDDEVALAGVLRSPFFSLSDDALLALARQRNELETAGGKRLSLAEALRHPAPPWLSESQQERMAFAGIVLAELRDSKDRLPLAGVLTLAVERTGYDAALLTEFLGTRKLANLRKLIDMARQFDRTGLFTLSDFVERLQESVGEETREPLAATHPESSDVIRLMSIHQSKGLEFPLVVVVDMDRRGNEQPPSARFDPALGPLVALPEKFGEKRENLGLRLLRLREHDENLAETLRLLYVATTRAADHLILSANLKRPGQVNHPWLKLLSERFDLSTGQPRLAPSTGGTSILAKYTGRLPEIHVHQTCPEAVPSPGEGRRERLPLRHLRETLARTPPAPLPATLATIPVDQAARRRFSVSEVREADAQLHGRLSTALDADDDARTDEDAPDDRYAAPPVGASGGEDARLVGDIVHLVLERIELGKGGDPAELVASASRAWSRPISAEARDAAIECVAAFLSSPIAAEMAAATCCEREIEFYLPWPTPAAGAHRAPQSPPRFIAGKLDCLLLMPDGTRVILDYKTGKLPKGKGDAHVLAEYEMQLAIYARAVRQLAGRWPARSELVLLRHGAMRVPFDPQTANWEQLTARVDAALKEIVQGGAAARTG